MSPSFLSKSQVSKKIEKTRGVDNSQPGPAVLQSHPGLSVLQSEALSSDVRLSASRKPGDFVQEGFT